MCIIFVSSLIKVIFKKRKYLLSRADNLISAPNFSLFSKAVSSDKNLIDFSWTNRIMSHSNPHRRLSMISVTYPPFLFFSCWNTRSRSRSSGVPFLSFSEYLRSLSLNSSVFLFVSSSLSRISACFLSKSFRWYMNHSRSREYPFWILPPFIQVLVWPRGFLIHEKRLLCFSATRSISSISWSSASVNCKAKNISGLIYVNLRSIKLPMGIELDLVLTQCFVFMQIQVNSHN